MDAFTGTGMKWLEVAVTVRPTQAGRAGDLLLGYSPQGFSDTAARHRRRVLRIYLPGGSISRSALPRLRRDLARTVGRVAIATRGVEDTAWLDAWKTHAGPIRIGRLTIQPSWLPGRRARGRTVVRLDPGMAFGSGEHPSTQLCLAAVERHARRGARVIDVGTGSGILAIAAARLGAGRVLAVDNDPIAVAVARANVRANHVAGRVRVRRGSGLARVRLRADLIVANLTADLLPAIVRDATRCLAPGGRFVGAGFGTSRVAEVQRALAEAGLRATRVDHLRGWRSVHATAAPSRSAR